MNSTMGYYVVHKYHADEGQMGIVDSTSRGSDTQDAIVTRNRQNATHSTGPKTAGGKARSSMNAVKHGLTSTAVIVPGEGSQDGAEIVESYRQNLGVTGPIGEELAVGLALTFQREQRLKTFEDNAVQHAVESAGDLEQYPETEVLDRLTKLLGAAQVVRDALVDSGWREANATVHGVQVVVKMLRSMVDAVAPDADSPTSAAVAGLEVVLGSLQQRDESQVDNLSDRIEGVMLGAVQVVQVHISQLESMVAELETQRAHKVERAVQLAQIPDEKTVRLIDRYRASNERSMLRKLEIVTKLRDLMLPSA